MKKNTFLILFIICLSISVFSQTEVVTVFEAVKIKNEKRAEALFYYENNWKKLREKASAKGYIHSYELIESKADEKADFDIFLITRYANQTQFEKAEENFQDIMKQRDGLKLLNDLKPNEFRENVFIKVGKSRLNTEKKNSLKTIHWSNTPKLNKMSTLWFKYKLLQIKQLGE